MDTKTSRWDRLQTRFKNSFMGVVVLSLLAGTVLVTNAFDVGQRLNEWINPPVADLLVTPLAGPNRPRPLDAYDIIRADKGQADKGATASTDAPGVYPRGAKVSVDLAHNRAGNATIVLRGIELVSQYTPGLDPVYAYKAHNERVTGAGPIKPLVFHVALFGEEVGPAMRIIDAKQNLFAISQSNENFLATDEPELFELTPADDAESIDIEVTAEEPGLYEISFVLTYAVLGEVKTKQTEPRIRIYYDGN